MNYSIDIKSNEQVFEQRINTLCKKKVSPLNLKKFSCASFNRDRKRKEEENERSKNERYANNNLALS